MNGLSWSAVYGHLSKHQFDVSRRITASFCEAPKASFLCIIEVISYTRMFIIDICWFYSTQSQGSTGSWFCFEESPSPILLSICIKWSWLYTWLWRCTCGQILTQTTHFMNHSFVWSQFDSRMDPESKSVKSESMKFSSEAFLWAFWDEEKRIPFFSWTWSSRYTF